MPKIIFTADPVLPRDIAHLAYKKGDVVMLSPDGCRKWTSRGVAKLYVEPEPEPEKPEPAVALRDRHHFDNVENFQGFNPVALPEEEAPEEVEQPRRGRKSRS